MAEILFTRTRINRKETMNFGHNLKTFLSKYDRTGYSICLFGELAIIMMAMAQRLFTFVRIMSYYSVVEVSVCFLEQALSNKSTISHPSL